MLSALEYQGNRNPKGTEIETLEGVMKRFREGPRIEDEARGYQHAHGDDVDDEDNFADSFEFKKGVGLLI